MRLPSLSASTTLVLVGLAASPPARRSAPPCVTRAADAVAQVFAVIPRPAAGDTTVALTVCLVTDTAGARIGGYYGEVTMAPAHRVLRIDKPGGGAGIEVTDVPGRISFAGAKTAGFASGPLLSVVLAHRASDDVPQIRLRIMEINTVAGRSILGSVRVDSIARVTTEVP